MKKCWQKLQQRIQMYVQALGNIIRCVESSVSPSVLQKDCALCIIGKSWGKGEPIQYAKGTTGENSCYIYRAK